VQLCEYVFPIGFGMVGTSVGKAIFTDLDFADDVALLAEMLSVLVLALEVMNEEAQPL